MTYIMSFYILHSPIKSISLFICSLVVSFAALALRARAANDTTRAQINNIPSKSHFIVLLFIFRKYVSFNTTSNAFLFSFPFG